MLANGTIPSLGGDLVQHRELPGAGGLPGCDGFSLRGNAGKQDNNKLKWVGRGTPLPAAFNEPLDKPARANAELTVMQRAKNHPTTGTHDHTQPGIF
jgi:hypothetical protein